MSRARRVAPKRTGSWIPVTRFPCTFVALALIWAMFALELAMHAPGHEDVLLRLGALPRTGFHLAQSWRLLSYALLHSGWLHIGLNTALVLIAGPSLERWLGRGPWLATALLDAVIGGLATLLAPHARGAVMVGASGALFAVLMAACLCSGPCHASSGMRRRLWITLAVGLAYSFMPNVSLAAHLGGMAVGTGMAFVLLPRRNKEPCA
ncbi:rhomboid family intramembrane serine protease [Pseudoxanthomonas winnipegensis]|uniref:rhomboid family intramembrane serine protease n=1 Tax=Pseudoxanthomonas winnipegensis TaxID=2480810 RepID=UPI0013F1615F|nr:rhomboid family intramembrane serine protease [Pseudoxanthomonas winnipegensis]